MMVIHFLCVELGSLLPDHLIDAVPPTANVMTASLQQGNNPAARTINKGTILKLSVDHIKELQSELARYKDRINQLEHIIKDMKQHHWTITINSKRNLLLTFCTFVITLPMYMNKPLLYFGLGCISVSRSQLPCLIHRTPTHNTCLASSTEVIPTSSIWYDDLFSGSLLDVLHLVKYDGVWYPRQGISEPKCYNTDNQLRVSVHL